MSDFSLTLGPVAFAGFELPSSITLGGHQRLAIHRLPGGIRIIDALGPEPGRHCVRRHLYGPGCGRPGAVAGRASRDRARPCHSHGDAFFYTVIVETFEADYRSPWWIPYRISCAVLRDEAAAIVTAVTELTPAISSDLLSAGSFGGGQLPRPSAFLARQRQERPPTRAPSLP